MLPPGISNLDWITKWVEVSRSRSGLIFNVVGLDYPAIEGLLFKKQATKNWGI
jgi:hypothetical protein